ncbi:hypothetical protein LO80_03380 [Candidatus Francisella endociliophora]|uniref:Uncharacterized protein n=1 Tax=Candidatus Francisella endociliophora TaxID=653937 RepID=A0A097ENG1_9GAMM|nr:replicative helicase loader/inhibitor [Francisella sp. FSC1006]AIT09103.1 hypothetical protein LO80_03380 [Francisella sp. FSC1006]
MIQEQTQKIVNLLDANYNILHDEDDEKNRLIIGTWHSVLKYYSYSDVGNACGRYISSNRVKPKPADIRGELEAMRATRHTAYQQIENSQKLDCEAYLTRQGLQDLFNREFAPFTKMSLPEHIKEKLRAKHNQQPIDDFVTKVWGFVQGSDFQIFHIEMAIGKLKGTKFTFEQFMKVLIGCREFSDDIMSNPNKLEACKSFMKEQLKAA